MTEDESSRCFLLNVSALSRNGSSTFRTQSGFTFLLSCGICFLKQPTEMVASFTTVWIAMACLFLVPSLTFGRAHMIPSMNSIRSFSNIREFMSSEGISSKDYDDFVHDDPIDNQANDIEFSFLPSRHASRTAKLRRHELFLKMSESEPVPCLPRRKGKRSRLLSDAYHIGDIEFQLGTRKEYGNWNRIVHAECSFLVGLSDFKKRTPNPNRPHEYLLSWNKLKTSCRVSNVINGLRDGKGEAEVVVGPLRMLVRMPESGVIGSPEVHISEARDAMVTIRDLGNFPNDSSKEIGAAIEKTVLCIVNLDVRNILMDSMRCVQDGSSSSCKWTDGHRTL